MDEPDVELSAFKKAPIGSVGAKLDQWRSEPDLGVNAADQVVVLRDTGKGNPPICRTGM